MLCGHAAISQDGSVKIPIVVSKPDKYVFFPLLVKSPEYKWGGGIGGIVYFRLKRDSLTRTSNLKLVSFYTVRKQMVVASEGTIYLPEEKFIVHYSASASRFPDKFWGIGNEAANEAEEDYTIEQVDVYPQVLKVLRPHLFAGIGYEFQKVFTFRYDSHQGDNLFDRENIAGRYGSKISGSGIILTWDSRDNAFSSTKGFYAQYFINAYRGFLGSDYDFIIQNLDMRTYFQLDKVRVLAFQVVTTHASGDVPIRDMSTIGSDSYMRGYYQGRFQDKTMFAVQSEFRTPLYKKIGMVVFAGTGKVGPTIPEALNFQHLKLSAGIGLRYAINARERLNVRFDAGWGKRSHGSYINMGEAF